MSWPMPPMHSSGPTGPWNPMVANMPPPTMTPMAPTITPGSMAPNMTPGCTPQQWAAMQNWMQWSQWQQQYAQWQSEYGEKYAQEMQAMQAAPPLPPNVAPPAPPPVPPPPEQPPPPPPHENNQPLYGQSQKQPGPVPPPKSQEDSNLPPGSRSETTIATVNAEALKKLAEEERLFDMQFQKWEDEIKKWKEDNVNHPDKQAYIEYEQKFEACRAQLLERRQLMKQKRASLLSNQAPPTVNVPDKLIISTSVPPPSMDPSQKFQNNHQNYITNPQPLLPSPNQPVQNTQYGHYNKVTPIDHANNNPNFQKVLPPTSVQYDQSHNNSRLKEPNNQKFEQSTPQQYAFKNTQFQQSNYKTPDSDWNNDETDQPDDMDQDTQMEYNTINPETDNLEENYDDDPYEDYSNNSIFMATSGSAQGIPGLDLVPDEKPPPTSQEVIDITEEREQSLPMQQGPDYSKISKGISNILGDEKIMNILSMVRGQTLPTHNNNVQNLDILNKVPAANNTFNTMQQSGHWDDKHSNKSFDSRQSILQNRTPESHYQSHTQNAHWKQIPERENNLSKQQDSQWQERPQWDQNPNFQKKSQFQQNPQFQQHPQFQTNSQLQPNAQFQQKQQFQQNPQVQQNPQLPQNSQLQPNAQFQQNQQFQQNPQIPQNTPLQQNSQWNNNRSGYNEEYPNKTMYEPRQSNVLQGQFYDRNQSNLNQNIPSQPRMSNVGPNIFQPGPPLQEMSGHDNIYHQQSNENLQTTENKPKWEVPMFNPSIIVDYEHKPLRLKARDFIEPVHMFDYNHRSKNEEYKTDFEREADELFSSKYNRYEFEDIRVPPVREQPSRDFERRPPRGDFREDNRGKMGPRDFENRSRESDNRLKGYDSRSRDYDRNIGIHDNRTRDYDDRRRFEDKYIERRREDRDKADRRGDPHYRRDDTYIKREDTFQRREDTSQRREDTFHKREDTTQRREDTSQRRDDTPQRRDRDWDRDDRGRDNFRDKRDSYRDSRRDESRNRSRSRDRDSRKRGFSKESNISSNSNSKKSKATEFPKVTAPTTANTSKHVVMIDDILEPPGRDIRPQKIVIILRGPPGSGKSYLAKLIRDREAVHGGTVRIMSIDDYFMQEKEIEEEDPNTGKMVKKPTLKYEYEEQLEETYTTSLKRAFKRTITDGYFTFLIYDAVNDQLKHYADIWNFARQNNFQVYICTMELDAATCFKRNIHGRTMDDIQVICSRFFPTPAHHIQIDPTTLLQNASITEVQMEDVSDDVIMEDAQEEPERDWTAPASRCGPRGPPWRTTCS